MVIREAGPWSQTVQSLLLHLEDVGFEGAPRVADSGFDSDGRETLTYIEGEIFHPGQPTVEAASAVGRLLRDLHEATASFHLPPDAVWQQWFGRELGGPHSVIGHGDASPWNIVTRDGLPFALIDWDRAGPIDPVVELAGAARLNANLYRDDIPESDRLPPEEVRIQQLKAMVEGYGLSRKQRGDFFLRMIEFAVYSLEADADEGGVTPETKNSEALWGMAWQARSAAWLLRHRQTIESVLWRSG